jgi:serine/threonine protein kinase
MYLNNAPPPQSIRHVIKALIPICQLLKTMETKGVGHLDIKIENILVDVQVKNHPGWIDKLYLNDWDFLSDGESFRIINGRPESRSHLLLDYLPAQYFPLSIRTYKSNIHSAVITRATILFMLGLEPNKTSSILDKEFPPTGTSSSYFMNAQSVVRSDTMPISKEILSAMDVYSMGLVFLAFITCPAFAPVSLDVLRRPHLSYPDFGRILRRIPSQSTSSAMKKIERAFAMGTIARSIRYDQDYIRSRSSTHTHADIRTFYDFLVLTEKMLSINPTERPSIAYVLKEMQRLAPPDNKMHRLTKPRRTTRR